MSDTDKTDPWWVVSERLGARHYRCSYSSCNTGRTCDLPAMPVAWHITSGTDECCCHWIPEPQRWGWKFHPYAYDPGYSRGKGRRNRRLRRTGPDRAALRTWRQEERKRFRGGLESQPDPQPRKAEPWWW